MREVLALFRLFFACPRQARRLVFYAEDAGYIPYLQGFLEEVLRNPGSQACYITSDPSDPLLLSPPGRVRSFYLRHLLGFAILFLDSKVIVMTMPDLHRYHIRRSVRGATHVYVFHAMVSTHMVYTPSAFDHYDALFCVGPHQVSEIRKTEEKQKLAPKRIYEVGYPPLDRLMEAWRRRGAAPPGARQGEGKGRVLIAPSWGRSNILESCVLDLARDLTRAGFPVTIRPHPEWIRRNPDGLRELRREIAALESSPPAQAQLDLGVLLDSTLMEADLLITDWSGIALEYAFGTERPVLYLDLPRKVRNPGYEGLGITPLEAQIRHRLGKVVDADEAGRIVPHVEELIRERASYQEPIRRERVRTVYHPGESARVGAQIFLELCR